MKLTKQDLMEYFNDEREGLTKKQLEEIINNVLDNLVLTAIEYIEEDIKEETMQVIL